MQGRRRNYRIAFDLSMKAYKIASKQHNDKIKYDKEKLKDTHYSLYFTILNKLAISLKDNKYKTNANSLRITRGHLAAIFNRAPQTISNRLKRLEKSRIIALKFHGNKAPIEIIFNPEIALFYDLNDVDFVPKTKFLEINKSILYGSMQQYFSHKKDTEYTSTDINITITDTDLTNTNTGTYKKENTRTTEKTTSSPPFMETFQSLPKEKAKMAEEMAKEISLKQKISFEKALQGVMKGVKTENKSKIPAQKKESKVSENESLTINYKEKQNEIVKEILHKEKQKNAKTLEDRRFQVRMVYVKMFVHHLIDNLFPHVKNQLTGRYYNELLEYAEQNYFSNCNSMKSLDTRWQQYKYRIDISKKLLKNYKNFDTTYFYPLAYLQVTKKGKNYLSFINTEKFWQNNREWKQKNGYNRRLNSDLRQKLNSIARRVELEKISYDDAIVSLKNLSQDNAELIRQFNLRIRANV